MEATRCGGGVVNAVTGHHGYPRQPHEGLLGQVSSVVGSNGEQVGSSANVAFGHRNWLLWTGGGGQRSGDYRSPLGEVENTKTRINNARLGVGWFGAKGFASAGYHLSDGRYGVPFVSKLHSHSQEEGEQGPGEPDHVEGEEELLSVDQDFRWNAFRFSGAFAIWERGSMLSG